MNEHETVINYQISVNSPKTGHNSLKTGHNSLKTGLVCNCCVQGTNWHLGQHQSNLRMYFSKESICPKITHFGQVSDR